MLIINHILFSIPIAIIAFTYSVILSAPGMIFDRLYDFLEAKLPDWLFKPLIGCEKCVSGQLALWCYYPFVLSRIGGKYDVFMHAFFICQSIFSTFIVKFIYKKITETRSMPSCPQNIVPLKKKQND